jgi:hypothetical protein
MVRFNYLHDDTWTKEKLQHDVLIEFWKKKLN